MYKTACSSILHAQRYKKRIKHTNYIQNPGHTEGFICNDMESFRVIFPYHSAK